MVTRLLTLSALALAMVLAACGSGPGGGGHDEMVTTIVDGDPEPQGITDVTTSHDVPGGWIAISIALGAGQEDIDSVGSAIAAAAPDVVYSFEESWMEFEIAPGHEDEITRCFSWALPGFSVSYDPETDAGQAVVDAVEQFDVVVGIDAFGLETSLPAAPHDEENMIECETRQLTVYVDQDLVPGIDELRTEFQNLPGVIATAMESQHEDIFSPDMSAYPELADCFGPNFGIIALVFDTADDLEAAAIQLENVEAVAGLSGTSIDPSLDPYFESDDEGIWELCQGVEGYVLLSPDITNEEAAVVVTRAAAIEGMADLKLYLIDPADIEPCPESSSDNEHVDCYVPTSELILYRGDIDLATPQIVSDALCDLPGVLWISVFDREGDQEFSDPYENCGSLNLTVYLDTGISEEAVSEVGAKLRATDGVASVNGPFFADYEAPEQVVVVGELDPLACLNEAETAPTINLDLERVTRDRGEAIASEISDIDGVRGVLGNAIERQSWHPRVCGVLGLSIHISRDMAAEDQADLLALFESRPDIKAVVIELPFEEEGYEEDRQWVSVNFNTDSPPHDLDALAASARAIPGVVEAEVWRWVWENYPAIP